MKHLKDILTDPAGWFGILVFVWGINCIIETIFKYM